MDNNEITFTDKEDFEFEIDWKRKLTSRKFWAAIALFVSGLMTALGKGSQAETVAGLIMQGAAVVAYIIGEGLADAANAGTIDVDFSNEE